MKSIILSCTPSECEKIANGDMSILVRKKVPNETPFKVYIYETKGATETPLVDEDGHYIYKGKGQVIGEFVCDNVERFSVGSLRSDDIEKLACLSYTEMINYFYKPEELDGKTAKQGFACHISDLKIYDGTKELSEFRPICKFEGKDFICNSFCLNYKYDGGLFFECTRRVTRPPENYIYVEE